MYTTCSEHILSILFWACHFHVLNLYTQVNEQSFVILWVMKSVDARMSASEKDLPVSNVFQFWLCSWTNSNISICFVLEINVDHLHPNLFERDSNTLYLVVGYNQEIELVKSFLKHWISPTNFHFEIIDETALKLGWHIQEAIELAHMKKSSLQSHPALSSYN